MSDVELVSESPLARRDEAIHRRILGNTRAPTRRRRRRAASGLGSRLLSELKPEIPDGDSGAGVTIGRKRGRSTHPESSRRKRSLVSDENMSPDLSQPLLTPTLLPTSTEHVSSTDRLSHTAHSSKRSSLSDHVQTHERTRPASTRQRHRERLANNPNNPMHKPLNRDRHASLHRPSDYAGMARQFTTTTHTTRPDNVSSTGEARIHELQQRCASLEAAVRKYRSDGKTSRQMVRSLRAEHSELRMRMTVAKQKLRETQAQVEHLTRQANTASDRAGAAEAALQQLQDSSAQVSAEHQLYQRESDKFSALYRRSKATCDQLTYHNAELLEERDRLQRELTQARALTADIISATDSGSGGGGGNGSGGAGGGIGSGVRGGGLAAVAGLSDRDKAVTMLYLLSEVADAIDRRTRRMKRNANTHHMSDASSKDSSDGKHLEEDVKLPSCHVVEDVWSELQKLISSYCRSQFHNGSNITATSCDGTNQQQHPHLPQHSHIQPEHTHNVNSDASLPIATHPRELMNGSFGGIRQATADRSCASGDQKLTQNSLWEALVRVLSTQSVTNILVPSNTSWSHTFSLGHLTSTLSHIQRACTQAQQSAWWEQRVRTVGDLFVRGACENAFSVVSEGSGKLLKTLLKSLVHRTSNHTHAGQERTTAANHSASAQHRASPPPEPTGNVKETKSSDAKTKHCDTATDGAGVKPAGMPGMQNVGTELCSNATQHSVPSDKIDATLTSLASEIQRLAANGSLCCLCRSEIADHCLLPCGHLCMCTECSEAFTEAEHQPNCPLCRQRVAHVKKVFRG